MIDYASPVSTESGGPALAAQGMVARILLVEDDRLAHRLVCKMLKGHEVIVAETVTEAMALLRKNPLVDLAIVDYMLHGEKGSSFVAELRQHAFFRDLPVVAYTSSQDREVVMRYAEFKVQAFHIKPFRAEVLNRELAVALKSGRRDKLLEPADSVCRRLKLKAEDYAGLLNSGAAMLEKDLAVVRRLLLSGNSAELRAALHNIGHRLPAIGIRLAAPLAKQVADELAAEHYHACTDTISVLDGIVALVRARAMELLNLGDSVVSAEGPASKSAIREEAVETEGVPIHLRDVLGQAIGVLGSRVTSLGLAPILAKGALAPEVSRWALQPPMEPWLQAIHRLDSIDETTIEKTASHLADISGYDLPMRGILLRTGAAKQHELHEVKWTAVVSKLGVAKAMVFVAAGQAGRCLARSPLALHGVRLRVVMMTLLGYEIGRFLRVTHPHRIAGSAIARASGYWILGNAEPVALALVLARAAHLHDLEQAERELLGGTVNVATAQWLKVAGLSTLHQDAASGAASADESRLTILLVQLTERLAAAVLAGDEAGLGAWREEYARSEAWAGFAELGVQPPVESAETADLLITLAKSAAWMAGEIVNA